MALEDARCALGAVVAMSPQWKTYFVALGLGDIAVETVLVSKLVLNLGHPTYPPTIIVSILLCSSGVGSSLSERIVGDRPGRLAVAGRRSPVVGRGRRSRNARGAAPGGVVDGFGPPTPPEVACTHPRRAILRHIELPALEVP